ncbi:MAG: hypothetical protein JNK35_03325 [Phycisphaerae bacterium]|nr:hypothetical protein [Phycisphaerae bacterium]
MAMIDIKTNPSAKDLRFFALFWLLTFAVLGVLSVWHRSENSLLYMGLFTGAAFLISITFNSDFSKAAQLRGVIIPGLLLGIWTLEKHAGVNGWHIAYALGAVGLVGAAAALVSPNAGAFLYRGWMFAALPIGWTVSATLMGIVFFLVITPIGLVLRALGKDPMFRRPDPAAATYWIPHRQETDRKRYFRQF